MKIGYQGIKGAYSYISARYLFPKGELIGFTSFSDAFDALSEEKVNSIVMPIENTIVGSINEVYDLIFEYKYWIKGDVTLKIDHNLLGIKNSKIKNITKVYSHTKALGQCKYFFKNNPNLDPIKYEDTAVSAGYISIKQDKTLAAIASLHAAEIYNLKILKKDIQTSDENYTRFVVIDSKNGKLKGSKTSLLFSTTHKPGSLLESLKVFADLNLTYIESRPYISKAWSYLFYLDFEHDKNLNIEKIIENMKPHTQFVRRLGTYNKGDFIKEIFNKKVDILKITN